ncbi:hypothetical protein RHMOL_Rhmol05G0086300 [Rhododendron molle]|uniref:Uncharacterized protein n=1 Tax=Rhododendron molle TaxID=49168 RepID=A0ACC0NLM9_RHOML|nr:hypothetical protein RHMOL_Rhmol05G0086300 [Rhododendron molle]
MLRSLLNHPNPTAICSLSPPTNTPQSHHHHHSLSTPQHYLRFRISHRENLRYLQTLKILHPETKSQIPPPPETLTQILSTVDLLKSKGFSDPDFPRLAFLCPDLFSAARLPHSQIESVFAFLAADLSASIEESHGLILKCPQILSSNVEFCLRPTVSYLRELGLKKLNAPSSLNAHLLNTRIDKLEEKVGFLMSVGLTRDESATVCARFPAIFGYSVENNLRPKFEYLVREMMRDGVEEVKGLPQYFGYSLEKRIVPRHLHLKRRDVVIPLKKMLWWGDEKFYAKWK